MALGRKKRVNAQLVAAQQVEERLDHMHATREERELARGVFRQLADGPDRPPLGTIVRRSVGAVVRSRKAADDGALKTKEA